MYLFYINQFSFGRIVLPCKLLKYLSRSIHIEFYSFILTNSIFFVSTALWYSSNFWSYLLRFILYISNLEFKFSTMLYYYKYSPLNNSSSLTNLFILCCAFIVHDSHIPIFIRMRGSGFDSFTMNGLTFRFYISSFSCAFPPPCKKINFIFPLIY